MAVHSLAACRFKVLEYEPAAHGRGVALPSGQKWASGQGTCSMVLALGQYEPAGHLPAQSELIWKALSLEPR